jgi:hypothetical protein
VSAGDPQITFTALRAISLGSARGTPAQAQIAMVCSVADASAAGSASSGQWNWDLGYSRN